MRESSWSVIAALTLSVLCAAPAGAAARAVQADSGALRVARLPSEVTATQCVQGGGVIIVSVDESGTGTFTKRCQGGTHDGETVL
ncbi:putative secreted protein [Streptomyces ambofaciens ATCC 23877]|uniref:Secreted protein n=2 Tax=Streptomyces ambofaciens TaxID=1889 RepID=A0ABN4PFB2_STRAM|nr:hypothetical protein [Streptomyces ambofaciens]AKZ59923.1 putative secreted protein [Streptomyces ambofaciens ATCC 23877]ANB10156.1 hypothetical protein SAM40697_6203 [Streptomyces ambofaciens]CAJ88411.1 putative secreted protein [Streptomyces ambofaciens ATCC 23877]